MLFLKEYLSLGKLENENIKKLLERYNNMQVAGAIRNMANELDKF